MQIFKPDSEYLVILKDNILHFGQQMCYIERSMSAETYRYEWIIPLIHYVAINCLLWTCGPHPVCQMKRGAAGSHTPCNVIIWYPHSVALIWPCYFLLSSALHTHLLTVYKLTHRNTHTVNAQPSALQYNCSVLLLIPASRLPEALDAARWLNVIVFSSESLLCCVTPYKQCWSQKVVKILVILRSSRE